LVEEKEAQMKEQQNALDSMQERLVSLERTLEHLTPQH
jgi:hypothetical protein